MNVNKSIIYHGQSDLEIVAYIKDLFGIEARPIQNGLKYLGYRIKPTYYRIVDWQWLAD